MMSDVGPASNQRRHVFVGQRRSGTTRPVADRQRNENRRRIGVGQAVIYRADDGPSTDSLINSRADADNGPTMAVVGPYTD